MNQFNISDDGWKVTITCERGITTETKKALYKLVELALEMTKKEPLEKEPDQNKQTNDRQ